jgi:hypothetical protein
LDQKLELGTEDFSPAVIRLAVHKGEEFGSFAVASLDLYESIQVKMSGKHIQRLSQRIGGEWADHRDQQVESYRQRQLARDYPKSAPAVSAVMVDSGKVQTRQEHRPAGVHDPHWRNTNVACCLTLKSKVSQEDPQPDPPRKFLDPPKVLKIVAEVHGRGAGGGGEEAGAKKKTASGKPGQCPAKASVPPRQKRRAQDPGRRKGPMKLVRTTVATMRDWDQFGWQVAAEVHRRSLDLASRKACVCDGQPCNWTLWEMHLQPSGFVAILDILHLLGYLYTAASAAAGPCVQAAWPCYQKWLTLAWSGKSRQLLAELQAAADKLGPTSQGASETDPRRALAETLRYVTHNQDRMDYPRYRKLGLPISSAPVESVIKQYNRRIKGSEKFWVEDGAEAMQQLRAAYLCDDGRAEKYWRLPRPHRHAAGLGRLHAAAA